MVKVKAYKYCMVPCIKYCDRYDSILALNTACGAHQLVKICGSDVIPGMDQTAPANATTAWVYGLLVGAQDARTVHSSGMMSCYV